jgi:hypothetical protein
MSRHKLHWQHYTSQAQVEQRAECRHTNSRAMAKMARRMDVRRACWGGAGCDFAPLHPLLFGHK